MAMSGNVKNGRPALDGLLRPRSVVLVGASDRSPWSGLIFSNFARLGYDGEIHLVNKRGADAQGRPAFASCREIPAVPDLAYVFVPLAAVVEALEDVAAAGIPHALVLSSGFAETGAEGRARQEAVAEICRKSGLRVLGPNCLGFINFVDRIAVTAFPPNPETRTGGVAIISQSGATASVLAGFAVQQGIGLSHVITTGNEADIHTSEIVEYLLGDPATRVIAIFAETLKDPAAFRRAARRASEAGKPIVILKVGRTELATKLAEAHTGSVTGDDRVFDVLCRQENVVRVGSLEALVTTAGILAASGRIESGIAIISISGGACEVIADAAEDADLELPAFSDGTMRALAEVMPEFGSVFNPLDVTGAAVSDPTLFEKVLAILAADPAIGMTACVYDLANDPAQYVNPDILACIGRGLRASRTPGLLLNQTTRPVSAFSRDLMEKHGIPGVTGGLDNAVMGLAAAVRWSRGLGVVRRDPEIGPVSGDRPRSEREALAHLQRHGVPVVPHALATTAAEAIAAWRHMGGPVVLKIASPDIAHKTDIGGVRLNLEGEQAITDAFDGIMAAARKARPDAWLEGCLVMPMRRGGIELFVGTAQTQWGPAIAVGLGGIWIELLSDTALRLLPVSDDDVLEMLGELRGSRILEGYRGAKPVDKAALAAAIRGIGAAALALGPRCVSLEVNPLLVDGDNIQALDALAIFEEDR